MATDSPSGGQPLSLEWQQVKRRVQTVATPFEKQDPDKPVQPHGFHMSTVQRAELERLTMSLPPATRSFHDVRNLLSLLRGADMLLQLDDDQQAAVVNAMRLEEYEKGKMVSSETHASADSFLLLVSGKLSVLVRDTSVRSSRAALRHLQPGECFAEGQILDQSKAMPSLVAGESATVLRLTKADFFAAHGAWQMELLERKVSALHLAPCFAGIEGRYLRPVAERMAQERRHADEIVIQQGSEPSRLYCIGSGECRVLVRTGGGLKPKGVAKVLQVATLGPGSIFGEVGVLFDVPHTASVVTSSDVTLYSLLKTDLASTADNRILEPLRAQARGYPNDAELLRKLQLADHWQQYKHTMIGAEREERRISKGETPFGDRPSLASSNQPPVRATKVVRQSNVIAPDGTPVSMLDLRDLHAGTQRREGLAEGAADDAGFEQRLSQYLAAKPGGEAWRGNAKLREYVKDEERARLRSRQRGGAPDAVPLAATTMPRSAEESLGGDLPRWPENTTTSFSTLPAIAPPAPAPPSSSLLPAAARIESPAFVYQSVTIQAKTKPETKVQACRS